MPNLPCHFEPFPRYDVYKVISMLKNYLAVSLKPAENKESIELIVKLINDR